MTERVWMRWLANGARELGWHVYANYDCASPVASKPYDCALLTIDGKWIAVEGKTSNNLKFDCRKIQLHQAAGLADVDRCGGVGIVLVNFDLILGPKQAKFYECNDHREVFRWLAVRHKLLAIAQQDGCSIDLNWFLAHGKEINRVRGNGQWILDPSPMTDM